FCAQLLGFSANSAKAFESASILDTSGFKLSDLYYVYYGSLATYQHQGPVWRKWREKMQGEFIKAQAGDGSWTVKGGHSTAMGSVIGTALVTLCLEAHYRYTPLYGLGFEPDPSGPSPNVIERHLLAETPLFRHAKHVALLSSPEDDNSPVFTDHGDFLYFASARDGGLGGMDLYRSRIGPKGLAEPRNLGPEVNSAGDETGPAVRMAGFHLMFNSDRDPAVTGLYGAKSRRVVRRFDYSKMPSGAWLYDNLGLLIGLIAALVLFFWLTWRALAQGRARATGTRVNVSGRGAAPSGVAS
ncbi:MAG: hypothetical protein OER86_10105, partial [Phycisphaerae bacterium]|nr:hypothetical protein [Phycisphaerae bacterium]